jgi:hypothetical protein
VRARSNYEESARFLGILSSETSKRTKTVFRNGQRASLANLQNDDSFRGFQTQVKFLFHLAKTDASRNALRSYPPPFPPESGHVPRPYCSTLGVYHVRSSRVMRGTFSTYASKPKTQSRFSPTAFETELVCPCWRFHLEGKPPPARIRVSSD